MKKLDGSLVLIFVAALAIRSICVIIFYGEIDTEGAEYARIAQNLLAGNGYKGISTEGTQLFFPPLFPLLISAIALVTSDTEIAGRALSVLFGSALIIPIYFIGRRLFGRHIALGGAALIAFHPYLILTSTLVNCEPTYYAILFAAICTSMRASEEPRLLTISLCGLLYGAAYLVRPEGLICMVVALVYIFAARLVRYHDHFTSIAKGLWLMPFCCLVLAAPYIVWISLQTGQLRVEAKSPLNIETELRIQSGLSSDEAEFAVNKEALAEGVWNQPNIDILQSSKPSVRQLLTMIFKKSKDVLKNSSANIASNLAFGSPALFAIAILGLFSRPWKLQTILDHVHLILLMGLAVSATFFIYYSHVRFFTLILIVMCIWSSAGLAAVFDWSNQSALMLNLTNRKQKAIARATMVFVAATVILPSAAFAGSYFLAGRDTRSTRIFASHLSAPGEAIRVAANSSPFAFHANAQLIWLPFCDEQTALRFLRKQRVTYVVVTEDGGDARSYQRKWIVEGVPNSLEVMPPISGASKRIRVFKLSPAG